MDRKPPVATRAALRTEVGFGCPIEGCRSPYLTWHHFDPPWREQEHHNPDGMIALCREHHDKADAGAYTTEQLHQLKALDYSREVTGRFDWLRNRLLAVVGGNFYYETPYVLVVGGRPVVWFGRDEQQRLLLNVDMLTTSGEPRLRIEDSYFTTTGDPIDFECPPSGRLIHAEYSNGDDLRVEFLEFRSVEDVASRYPDSSPSSWSIEFPMTAVEITSQIAGTSLRLGPRETELPGHNVVRGSFASHCKAGMVIG